MVARSLASKSGRLVAMLVYMWFARGMPGSYLRAAKDSMAVDSMGGSRVSILSLFEVGHVCVRVCVCVCVSLCVSVCVLVGGGGGGFW